MIKPWRDGSADFEFYTIVDGVRCEFSAHFNGIDDDIIVSHDLKNGYWTRNF